MSKKEAKYYTAESVDMIYKNAERISYNQGFLDGYRRGVNDAKEMIDKLAGGEE